MCIFMAVYFESEPGWLTDSTRELNRVVVVIEPVKLALFNFFILLYRRVILITIIHVMKL